MLHLRGRDPSLGLPPTVVSATSSFMILFTASSTSLQYLIIGRVPWQSALVFFAAGFLGALVGQAGLAYLVKKYRRQSYVTLLLGVTIAGSGIALLVINIVELTSGVFSSAFSPLCSAFNLTGV